MPEAVTITSRTSSDVEAGFLCLVAPGDGGELTISVRHDPAERELLLACRSVQVRGEAMRLLTHAVADMSPKDPRHEASYTVVEQLRPDWVSQLARVSAIPAQGARGISAKAELIASLVENGQADRGEGPPALRIAASVAHDLLVLGGS